MNTKDLLQKSDIQTMAKDISQLKKGLFFKKPVVVKKKIETEEPIRQHDIKEKVELDKILDQSVKQRHEQKEQQKPEPNIKEPPMVLKPENHSNEQKEYRAPERKPEAVKENKKEYHPQEPMVPVKEKAPISNAWHSGAGAEEAKKEESPQRKKFMEEIETWTSQSK